MCGWSVWPCSTLETHKSVCVSWVQLTSRTERCSKQTSARVFCPPRMFSRKWAREQARKICINGKSKLLFLYFLLKLAARVFCSPSRAFSEKEGGLENVCVYARHPYWAALWYAPFVLTPVRKLWSSLLCQSKSWRGWVKIGQSPLPSTLRRLPGLTLAPRLASARTRFCVWVRWKCHHFFSRLTQPRGMLS